MLHRQSRDRFRLTYNGSFRPRPFSCKILPLNYHRVGAYIATLTIYLLLNFDRVPSANLPKRHNHFSICDLSVRKFV